MVKFSDMKANSIMIRIQISVEDKYKLQEFMVFSSIEVLIEDGYSEFS